MGRKYKDLELKQFDDGNAFAEVRGGPIFKQLFSFFKCIPTNAR